MALLEKDLYLKIGRPNNSCVACGAAIAGAGKHPSVIRQASHDEAGSSGVEGQAQNDAASSDVQPDMLGDTRSTDEPRREDYCAECWQKMPEKDYLGYWLARREPPKARKIESRKERNAGVLAWFEHLQSQAPDEENLQAQYFLAHLLMKYGVFKWLRTDAATDGTELIIFKQPGTDEELTVRGVDLPGERSMEIKAQLDKFLEQYANKASQQGEQEASEAAED